MIQSSAKRECTGHAPIQHRDGKEPWCRSCGLTASFTIPKQKYLGHADSEPSPILTYFNFRHLPTPLQEISRPFGDLAWEMEARLVPGRQKDMALEFLLLAKDAAVRSAL